MVVSPKKENVILRIKESHSALSVQNLSIGYKNEVVCSAIHFDVLKGEFMGIIGTNGIGKSTLIRTLAKVQPKLSGSILVHGTPLEKFSANQLSTTLSVVLTDTMASKNMTVFELVALGRQPYTNWIGSLSSLDTNKINDALHLLELEDLQFKKCFELSDGQLQRVMIARALAQDTKLIVLDEPTTHLDLYHKIQILKLLQSVAKKTNKTILFTSHEIEMAIQLCDRLLVLNNTSNAFGSPQKLIQEKAFDTLFPKDTLTFNANTGSFKIKK